MEIDLCVVHIRPMQVKLYSQISTQLIQNSISNLKTQNNFWYTFLHEKFLKNDGFVVFNQFKDLQLLNGCRDAELCLELLRKKYPSDEFQSLFRILCHLITFWAKRRSIYSHIVGYLGGYSWRVLLISVLLKQKEPIRNLESCQVFLGNFFHELGKYHDTVSDDEILIYLNEESKNSFLKHFERKVCKKIEAGFDKIEKKRLLIITPTPVYQNSARNVTRSTLDRLLSEMSRGEKMCQDLKQLCEPFQFFQQDASYIRLTLESNQEDFFLKWKGHVLSRLVSLIERLESINRHLIVTPHPKEYSNSSGGYNCSYYIAVKIKPNQDQLDKQKIYSEIQHIINEYIQSVYQQIQQVEVKKRNKVVINKEERSFDLSIKFIKNSKLPKD